MFSSVNTRFPEESVLPAAVQTWRPEARSELFSHLSQLGLGEVRHALRDIVLAEVERARALEPRVDAEDGWRFSERAREAQALFPAPHALLAGFTRRVNTKFQLTGPCMTALVDRLPTPEQRRLFPLVEGGPPDGSVGWPRPEREVELLATLVRHMLLQPAASLQLRPTAAVVAWLGASLDALEVPVHVAAGGAGILVSNLAAAFPQVRALSWAPASVSPAVAARYGRGVELVGPDGRPTPPSERTDPRAPTPLNYSAEYLPQTFSLFGLTHLALWRRSSVTRGMEQVRLPLEIAAAGRVLVTTPTPGEPGFGSVAPEVLRALGGQLDTLFWTGAHAYAKGSAAECRRKARALAAGIRSLKEGNPGLWSHCEYVPPPEPEHERALFETLRGVIDSLDLNTDEAHGLLGRLGAPSASEGRTSSSWDPAWGLRQHPGAMARAAEALLHVLQLRQTQVRGRLGDVFVLHAGGGEPSRLVLAAIKARQAASNKVANRSGEIREARDLWPVVPAADARGLVALYAFVDAMAERFHLSVTQRARILERYAYTDARRGVSYVFVPGRGLHYVAGGETSAGDVIGGVVQLCGRQPDDLWLTQRSA